MIKIYTDGSCRKNGKEGAVGACAYCIINEEGAKLMYGARKVGNTTNQQMELMAAIDGLKAFEALNLNAPAQLFTDSAYLHNCYKDKWYERWEMNGWKTANKTPVLNKELWEQLIPYFKSSKIEFMKCTGHADDEWNNYVDALAQMESKI